MDLAARLRINQLVEQNWQQLLDLAKDVLDCRLADGIITWLYQSILLLLGSFEFPTETEQKEKILFDAVKRLMDQLPANDS